ncbi:HAMP domain-containing histidine kinase [Paenibacillus doosanensis]|uniref:sensor histidine kinase n=1 Tax=Paenibacillus doosanensis TaxID=1229154 RepID=UPI0021809530|nr:HAMP domain-containing sensor histidine kinase [Paenibacillus doosanensis]MCS7461226.1 HAMP domain-containing histidine kinase [Paenibacillus doosanensis]
MTDFNLQKEYSNEISRLRYLGDLDGAIDKCKEAIVQFPNSNFFYKILGDILVQKGDFDSASVAYINQLKLIGERPEQFKNFARFYQILKTKTSDEFIRRYQKIIMDEVQRGKIPIQIKEKFASIFESRYVLNEKIQSLLKKMDDDKNLSDIVKTIDALNDIDTIRTIIKWRIDTEYELKTQKIDEYFISVAEKYELYNEALKLGKRVIINTKKPNPTIIRSLFRICRKQKDYSIAENIFEIDSKFILNSDFNIQYELVYYFEYIENVELLERTLKRMRDSATSSIPISRTLYNFYLKFNKFEEAKVISEHIKVLESGIRRTNSQVSRIEEQFESEQGIWDKLQGLVTEQEHNRQMIAMRELLKGFSHELGQPITNIRYSTQLYQMKAQKGVLAADSINVLLKMILSQTDRIGKLLARFRPIVSSKSKNEKFSVYDRINAVFLDLSVRLKTSGINYSLQGNKKIQLWGDPVQFDQVFYNLIINSMQAISEVQQSGKICVTLSSKVNDQIIILFSDNGPGIGKENAKKIFEPFYSTKDPSSQNDGGEGLGLFIVWNVLKMFNGSISLDINHEAGAKFIISINQKRGALNE